jgi:thiol-disulfide isomerase/thioredoxin
LASNRRVIVVLTLGLFLTGAALPDMGRAQQTHRIPLSRLTTLDGPLDHLEILESVPPEAVRLPAVDTTGALFLSVFYSWHQTNDPRIVIMVLPASGGDSLYIDRNYDGDLSNDGAPEFFPSEEVEHPFEIVAHEDPRQRTRLLLARTLNVGVIPDSLWERYVDRDGNLTPAFARFIGRLKGKPTFDGRCGTFFWDGRISLRRGTLELAGDSIALGLFDLGNNGLFNDSDDVLLIDREGTGHLTYMDEGQIVALEDVFSLGANHWRVAGADRYGTWIDLRQTDEAPTALFEARRDSVAVLQAVRGATVIRVDSSLWALTGETINGDTVGLSRYRGGWLLLNFWGEWCGPCLQEIPVLLEATHAYAELQIVGFLRTNNLPKARDVISSKGMTWPQLRLVPTVEKQFGISAFPTNLLLFPDGLQGIRLNAVSVELLGRLLKR